MPKLSSAALTLGFIFILHAMFSGIHYKSWAASLGEDVDAGFVPLDVKLEVLLGLGITLLGTLLHVGTFQPINASQSAHEKTWTQFHENPNFRVFNHRASAIRKRIATADGS